MALLKSGATGPQVTALQQQLKQRGFDPGPIDGNFGPSTDAAVRAFQQSVGLPADGVAGANTLAALAMPSVTSNVTVDMVAQMFPVTPRVNIQFHLPYVLKALLDAAQHRVFGFEILPAPFVVSHLQLGLLLQNLGAPLSDKGQERVAVYLTNALTGWEPPKGPKKKLLFPELEEERDAAEHVKRDAPILVILGNPPYNAFAGVSPDEEHGLVESYKEGLIAKWGIKKFNLDDLYVRFFRLAERRIAEGKPGKGIVCYISNFSYLSDPSFVTMRERFLKEFDKLWFDCMNGDSRETGKLTPDGKPDPSVFSTEYNREGIRVGTAIGLLVRVGAGLALPEEGAASSAPTRTVHFRNFWGYCSGAL